MTKGSLTATHATVSTPLARRSSARSTKPGRWWSEHVGVNAPGTANSTTLPLPSTSPLCAGRGPSSVMVMSFTSGMRSPTEIAITLPPACGTTPRSCPIRAGGPHAGAGRDAPAGGSRPGRGRRWAVGGSDAAAHAPPAGGGVVDEQGDDGPDDRADDARRLHGALADVLVETDVAEDDADQ